MRILIVEDEEALANGLRFNCEQEGYEVVVAKDGESALEYFGSGDTPIDVVILDLMLPGMSGYEICRRIRQVDNQLPILVLSALTRAEDKAEAFDSGADQYVTKPFALPELLSRIRNLLERKRIVGKRKGEESPKMRDEFAFGNVVVDFPRYEILVGGRRQSLTTMEMDLLRYFIEHEGRVLSRADILENVWGQSPDVTTRTIDNFVMRLRRLIEPDPSTPRFFLSQRGTGYRFVASPDDATVSGA